MEQVTKILLRVEQLLSLAGGATTPVEEARTAAMAVVRLIQKHKLVIVSPEEEDTSSSYGKNGSVGTSGKKSEPKPPPPWEDDPMFRRNPDGSFVYGRAKPSQEERPKRKAAQSEAGFIRIISKFDGRCRECGESYDTGDTVFWRPQEGCWHEDCVADEDKPSDKVNDRSRRRYPEEF
jgi:hypothetical protein